MLVLRLRICHGPDTVLSLAFHMHWSVLGLRSALVCRVGGFWAPEDGSHQEGGSVTPCKYRGTTWVY
jgi:hypothetical protein